MSADESKTNTPQQPAAAKRRRLSLASWNCGFAAFFFWIFVAVPGMPRVEFKSKGEVVVSRDFGWPTVHCTSTEWDFLKEELTFWSTPSNWKYWGNGVETRFHWFGVIVNLFVLVGTIIFVVCVSEFRIRTRGGFFRFRLWELMTAFVFVAILVQHVDSALKESTRDHQTARAFYPIVRNSGKDYLDRDDYGKIDWQFIFPDFFRRLFDDRDSISLPWFSEPITLNRVEEITVYRGLDLQKKAEQKALIQCLEQFNSGTPVRFVIHNDSDWLLAAIKNARHLELSAWGEEDFEWLRDFRNLETFDYDGPTKGSLESLLKEFPNPEKLLSLSVRSELKVDETTDFGRFTKLKTLKLSLSAEEKAILLRNHPRVATILQDNDEEFIP